MQFGDPFAYLGPAGQFGIFGAQPFQIALGIGDLAVDAADVAVGLADLLTQIDVDVEQRRRDYEEERHFSGEPHLRPHPG